MPVAFMLGLQSMTMSEASMSTKYCATLSSMMPLPLNPKLKISVSSPREVM